MQFQSEIADDIRTLVDFVLKVVPSGRTREAAERTADYLNGYQPKND